MHFFLVWLNSINNYTDIGCCHGSGILRNYCKMCLFLRFSERFVYFRFTMCCQSYYREVAGWEISMKNIWDLGWFWAGWQYWKNKLGRLLATFEVGFFMFSGGNKNLIFFKEYCNVCTKKLLKIKIRKMCFFSWKNNYRFFYRLRNIFNCVLLY